MGSIPQVIIELIIGPMTDSINNANIRIKAGYKEFTLDLVRNT